MIKTCQICSLNWLNVLGRENIFDEDCWDDCAQKWEGKKLLGKNGEVKNCWAIEEESVSGDCKDDLLNK